MLFTKPLYIPVFAESVYSVCVVYLEHEPLNRVKGKNPGIINPNTHHGDTGHSVVHIASATTTRVVEENGVPTGHATNFIEENVKSTELKSQVTDKSVPIRRKRKRTTSNEYSMSSSSDTETEVARMKEIKRQSLSLRKYKKLRRRSSESSGNSVETVKSAGDNQEKYKPSSTASREEKYTKVHSTSSSVQSWKSGVESKGLSQSNYGDAKYSRVHSDVYVEEGANSGEGKKGLLQKVLLKKIRDKELENEGRKSSTHSMTNSYSESNTQIVRPRSSSRERKLPKRLQEDTLEDYLTQSAITITKVKSKNHKGDRSQHKTRVTKGQSNSHKRKDVSSRPVVQKIAVKPKLQTLKSIRLPTSQSISDEKKKEVTKIRGKLPEEGVAVLKSWLYDHRRNPYPSEVDKEILAKASGLRVKQVSDWLINARRRFLPLMKGATEETYAGFAKRVKIQKQSVRNEKEHKHYNSDAESLFSTASDTDWYTLTEDSTDTASENEAEADVESMTDTEGSSVQELLSIFQAREMQNRKEGSQMSQKTGSTAHENSSLDSNEMIEVEIIRESEYERERMDSRTSGMLWCNR